MPILNFNPKAAQQQLIDITRNRSTESTEDATGAAAKQLKTTTANLTPPTSPSHPQLGSWRTKEMSSIVRSPPRNIAASQELEDMWTLKRCDAFDEDDDDC